MNTVSDNTGRLIDIRSGENLDGYYKIIDCCIIGNYLQGRREGRLETYHSSGNIKLIGDYRDRKKHSEWKEYDDQQRVVWIRYYDKGCPNGTWIRYGYSCGLPVIDYEECYENGKMRMNAIYRDGCIVGKRRYYNENGNLLSLN